ncbi:hypothetical protein KXD93_22610 [Mucilaginibacter sp. BJC16-A38]|uniref:hypothetical protein n=1 Tax=Mucilaginibacter phenanthrenivorans TaxID=1234842 RepID=UPI002156FCCC|nr:hypothetical protein [Mucilaginibacter phenanthrenivorans]MCR8560464.1 hypothetical protein [Mucilaginibacter phenanthrenivorans]
METKVKEVVKNGVAVKKENPVTVENKNPQFVAGNPVNRDSAKVEQQPEPAKEAPKAEQAQSAQVKAAVPQPEQVKPGDKKPVLNLDGTLKLVEELHRKKIQRDKLLETIDNLEGFEFDLKEEADETGGNIYQGCALTITDDKRQTFTTKNPTIIWTVAQMVNRLCVDKLAEIESGIQIPA